MQTARWRNLPLLTKLGFVATLMMVGTAIVLALISSRQLEQLQRSALEREAELVLNLLEAVVSEHLTDPKPLTLFAPLIDRQRSEPLPSILVLDTSGNTLFETWDSSQIEVADDDPLWSAAVSNRSTVLEWGSAHLTAVRSVWVDGQVSGVMLVQLSTIAYQEGTRDARNASLFTVLAVLGIGLGVTWGFSQVALTRQRKSQQLLESTDGDNLVQRILHSGEDDVRIVGHAVERMRSEMRELYAGLERQVADRTRQLQASEERFRRVISSIGDVVYMAQIRDRDDREFLFVSPNFLQLTGRDPQLIIGSFEQWIAMVYPDDFVIVTSQWERFSSGISSESEYRIVHDSGDIVWVRDNGRVEAGSQENELIIYGVVSNITERQATTAERERLLVAEREQRLLAETLAELTLALASETSLETLLDDILRYANRVIPYTQASISLLEGDTLHLVRWRSYDLLKAESREEKQPLGAFSNLVEIVQTRRPVTISDTSREPRWANVPGWEWIKSYMGIPICLHDRVLGLLQLDGMRPHQFSESDADRLLPLVNAAAIAIENARLVSDLGEMVAERTADMQTEQGRSEAILRSVSDAIALHDLEKTIQYVNRSFQILTGYGSDELVGNSMEMLGVSAKTQQQIDVTLSKEGLWQGEVRYIRKSGQEYDAMLTVTPVHSAEGHLIGFVSSHNDISEDKALEQVRSAFMTNISHQLRTPVTNIKLYVDLLKRKGSTEETSRYLAILLEQTTRLEHLVQDIIQMTSIDSGRVATNQRELNLASLVETVSIRYEGRLEEAGLTMQVSPVPRDLPAVIADESWLARALGELVENAITFTPSGGLVGLSTELTEIDGAAWVSISVSDTGPGISFPEQSKIFDRFFRGSLADSGHVPGTGLGLSIVTEILRAHGGRVTVNSEPGFGSEFTIWLPTI